MESVNKINKKSKLPPSMKPVISNVVACVNFCCEFDLQKIAQSLKNVEYNPNSFFGVILTIDEPKSKAVIFKHGKANIIGTKTPDEAYISARKTGKILSKIDYNVKIHKFKIMSINAKCNCNFEVDLEEIASNKAFKKLIDYNPSHFSGLIFKVPESNISLYIHESGKIRFIGAKEMNEIDHAVNFIWPILQENEKSDYDIEYDQPYADWQQYEQAYQPFGAQYEQSYSNWQPYGGWYQYEQPYVYWQSYGTYGDLYQYGQPYGNWNWYQ